MNANSRGKSKPLLYIASLLLFLIVLVSTILPIFFGGSDFLYQTSTLTILYAILSLAVAMITFGVIGDSGALGRYGKEKGHLIQISGSAMGFIVFYYLLSTGLNPYRYLDIYLHNSKNQILNERDGEIEVKLVSHITQIETTSNGHAGFPVPRSHENVRLSVQSNSGQLWQIDSILPAECVGVSSIISTECSEIDVYLNKRTACLNDFNVVSYEAEKINTDLQTVLDSLKETLQNISPDLPANVIFSEKLLTSEKHKTKFELNRKNKKARSVCEHIAAIENAFNWSQNKNEVKGYLRCDSIYFTSSEEGTLEGFEQCL